jgi:hypothetical protein
MAGRKARPEDLGGPISDVAAAVARVEALVAVLSRFVKSARQLAEGQDSTASAKLLRELRRSIESLAPLREQLFMLEQAESERGDQQFLELEANLREGCTRRGWRLEGAWPTLYVERGIQVSIDEGKRTATVGGQQLSTAAIADVITVLESLVPGLVPRRFEARDFLSALVRAYDELRPARSQVSIFDIYRTFVMHAQASRFWRDARADAFVGVSADQFRARLSRTLEGDIAVADGRVLRLLPPLDSKDGLFVYQPLEQRFGYVGRLEFVRPNQENA